VTLVLVDLKKATGKDIAEYVMRPAKVLPASLLKECDAQF
jgi:hypothetical protein